MYGKLVRDRIPEIIYNDIGEKPKVRKLTERKEIDTALLRKLVEEALEVQSALDRSTLLEELADVEQVLIAIRAFYGISPQELEWVRKQKLSTHGGFSEMITLLPSADTGGS